MTIAKSVYAICIRSVDFDGLRRSYPSRLTAGPMVGHGSALSLVLVSTFHHHQVFSLVEE